MQNIVKKEGFTFSFDQSACMGCNGACCRGESGYVWVSPEEIEAISEFLKMDTEDFIREYLKKSGYKWSIKEIKQGGEYLCAFFDKGCTIYPVRPKQCREFPFWDRYKDAKNIQEVVRECPGIVLD